MWKHLKSQGLFLKKSPKTKNPTLKTNPSFTDKPEFLKAEDHVNTGIGYDAELHCVFESNPAPMHVHWYKVSPRERIHEGDKYRIINDFDKKERSRTSLQIKDVNQQDLIRYSCEVENILGKSQSSVMLDMHPSTPHLHSKDYSNGVLKTIWTVKSLQPLQELQVSYLKNVSGPAMIF